MLRPSHTCPGSILVQPAQKVRNAPVISSFPFSVEALHHVVPLTQLPVPLLIDFPHRRFGLSKNSGNIKARSPSCVEQEASVF
jgi:hypothetical protein